MDRIRPIVFFNSAVKFFKNTGLRGDLVARDAMFDGPLGVRDKLIYKHSCGKCMAIFEDSQLYLPEDAKSYVGRLTKWITDIAKSDHDCSKSHDPYEDLS